MHKRTNEDGSQVLGRLNLVDLAGSERIAKTEAKGQQLREATCINQSLTCLGSCIKSLIQGHNHIPYRDSKLTFILRDALNGENSKTTLICTVSKEMFHLEESVQTLEFAQRARNVKTKAVRNIKSPSNAINMHVEIAKLRSEVRCLEKKIKIR